jgi:hypothetical protein
LVDKIRENNNGVLLKGKKQEAKGRRGLNPTRQRGHPHAISWGRGFWDDLLDGMDGF